MVNTDVTVLSSRGVALACRVGSDGVEGAEVTADTADFVLKDLVVESGLELTLTGRGGGDIHGGLTTSEDDKVLLGGDGGAVEGGITDVGLEDGEVARGDELGRLVLAGGDEVGPVGGPLQVDDGLVELVDGEVVVDLARLGVVLADAAVFVAGNDVLAEGAPAGNGGLALVANDGEDALVALLSLGVRVDVVHDNVAEVSHALLRDSQQLRAILVELDALDGGRELPRLDKTAGLDIPQTDRVVGRARGNHGRGGVDIDGPDGSDVAVVCTETLAVVCEPSANLLILGNGEDEVAIEVISITRKKSQYGGLPYDFILGARRVGGAASSFFFL